MGNLDERVEVKNPILDKNEKYHWLLERVEWWDKVTGELVYVSLTWHDPFKQDSIDVWLLPDRKQLCKGYLGSRWAYANNYHYGGYGCIELPEEKLREIAKMLLEAKTFEDYRRINEMFDVPITSRWHA